MMQDHLPPQLADRFKALLLILLAIFGFGQFASGRLHFFLSPRMSWLVWVAVALSILIASSYNLASRRSEEAEGESLPEDRPSLSLWALLLLGLPIILGLVVPALPLDARSVTEDGLSFSLPSAADEVEGLLTIPAEDRGLLDWVRVYGLDSETLFIEGLPAEVSGFVYRDARLADDQIILARYTLRCCFAGARAVGILVENDDVSMLIDNTWVEVTGTFAVGELDGQSLPVLQADELTIIEPPEQPYLFP